MFTLVGILLLVIGASLVFAVERQVEGVDLLLVGWILMAGGVTALVFAIARFAERMNEAKAASGARQHDAWRGGGAAPAATYRDQVGDPHSRAQHHPGSERRGGDRGWAA